MAYLRTASSTSGRGGGLPGGREAAGGSSSPRARPKGVARTSTPDGGRPSGPTTVPVMEPVAVPSAPAAAGTEDGAVEGIGGGEVSAPPVERSASFPEGGSAAGGDRGSAGAAGPAPPVSWPSPHPAPMPTENAAAANRRVDLFMGPPGNDAMVTVRVGGRGRRTGRALPRVTAAGEGPGLRWRLQFATTPASARGSGPPPASAGARPA